MRRLVFLVCFLLSSLTAYAQTAPNTILFAGPSLAITSAPQLTFDTAGKLGIYTSIPQANFHVNTPALFTDTATFRAGNAQALITIGEYPNQDIGVWENSSMRLGQVLDQQGGPSNNNQFGLGVQVTIPVSNSAVSYEKAAIIAVAGTADPSDYGAMITRDTVGVQGTSIIGTGNMLGRVWGGSFAAQSQTGSDGLMTGIEVDLVSRSPAQSEVDQTNTKVGITSVAGQGTSNDGTVSIGMLGGNAHWYKGLYGRQASFLTSFIELDKTAGFTDLFRVKPTGQTLIGDLENNSSLTDYASSVYGQLGVAGYATIIGSGGTLASEKHALYLFSDVATSKHRIGTSRYDGSVGFWPLALDTSGNEVLQLTTDPFLQLTTSYTGGTLCASGTSGLRNNAGTLEVCNNGGAWTSLAGSAFWTRASGTIYPTTNTDRILSGFTSSDISDNGVVISNQFLYAISGTTNASVASIGYDSGSSTVRVASGRTGSGTYRPMGFLTNGSEAMRVHTSSNVSIGATTDNGYKLEVTGDAKVTTTIQAASAVFTGTVLEELALDSTNSATQLSVYSGGSPSGMLAGNTVEFDMCWELFCSGGGLGLQQHGVNMFGSSAGAPSTPGSGTYTFFIDSSDGDKLKVVGPSGTVTLVALP